MAYVVSPRRQQPQPTCFQSHILSVTHLNVINPQLSLESTLFFFATKTTAKHHKATNPKKKLKIPHATKQGNKARLGAHNKAAQRSPQIENRLHRKLT
jgi:hypothetical protein